MSIIIANITIGDWEGFGSDGYIWNFWRFSSGSLGIGLLVDNSDWFKLQPNTATWSLIFHSPLYFLQDHFKDIDFVKYSELELTKKEIDLRLDKISKLKSFL